MRRATVTVLASVLASCGSGVTAGWWEAGNHILHVRTRESPGWTVRGRHPGNDNDLLIHLPGGGKQLWSRR